VGMVAWGRTKEGGMQRSRYDWSGERTRRRTIMRRFVRVGVVLGSFSILAVGALRTLPFLSRAIDGVFPNIRFIDTNTLI
jgi:hypothetical protein